MSGEEHLAGSACMSCMDATWRNEAILVPSLFGSPSRAERNHEERESDTVHELQTRQVVSKALSESGDAFDGTLITSVQPCADLESLSAASDGISSSPKVVSTVPAIQDRRYTAIHEPQPRPTPRPWLPTPAPVAEVALKSTSTPIQPLALTNVEQPSEMPPDSEPQPSQAQSAATPSSHAKPPSSRVQFAAPPSRGSPCGFSCAPKRAASRTPLSAAAAPRPTRPSLASIARAPSCMTRTSATHGSAGRNSILPGRFKMDWQPLVHPSQHREPRWRHGIHILQTSQRRRRANRKPQSPWQIPKRPQMYLLLFLRPQQYHQRQRRRRRQLPLLQMLSQQQPGWRQQRNAWRQRWPPHLLRHCPSRPRNELI